MITVYTYSNCDSCRRAVKWLRARGIPFHEKAIRQTPPSLPELRAMLAYQKGEIRRIFNTGGREYRALKLHAGLVTMAETEALALLARHGNLVKRPFLLAPECGLVGFDAAAWERALG